MSCIHTHTKLGPLTPDDPGAPKTLFSRISRPRIWGNRAMRLVLTPKKVGFLGEVGTFQQRATLRLGPQTSDDPGAPKIVFGRVPRPRIWGNRAMRLVLTPNKVDFLGEVGTFQQKATLRLGPLTPDDPGAPKTVFGRVPRPRIWGNRAMRLVLTPNKVGFLGEVGTFQQRATLRLGPLTSDDPGAPKIVFGRVPRPQIWGNRAMRLVLTPNKVGFFL